MEADMENCRKVSSEKPGFAPVLSSFEVFCDLYGIPVGKSINITATSKLCSSP